MKRICLVKKDPLMPPSDDNWIVMNYHDYLEFMKTPEGQSRKENFAQLNGVDEDDVIYIVESNTQKAKQIRAERDAHDYLTEQENLSGYLTLSMEELTANLDDDLSAYDIIEDPSEDVVANYLRFSNIETLFRAIESLDDEEKWIINKLFLDENTCSLLELSQSLGIPYMTLSYKKSKIFRKIKKFFREKWKKVPNKEVRG